MLPLVTSAVPWMTAIARQCSAQHGAITASVSGPAALLLRLAADSDVRPAAAELSRLLPHVIATLRMGCANHMVALRAIGELLDPSMTITVISN